MLDKEEQGMLIADGKITLIKPEKKKFTLEELQKVVNGYVEVIASPFPEYITIVDEEGKLKNEKPNDLAYLILKHELVGKVLVIPSKLLD